MTEPCDCCADGFFPFCPCSCHGREHVENYARQAAQIRPRGKSKVNEVFRKIMAEKGIEPCLLCAVEGKWEIYHTPEHPCPKRQPEA